MRSRTPTKTIIATLQDYINTDIKAHMEEDCFEVFMQQLAADVFQQSVPFFFSMSFHTA